MDEQKRNYLEQAIRDHLALGRGLSEISRRLRAIASEEEIQEALDIFRKQAESNDGDDKVSILMDDSEHRSWYEGPSLAPDSHWNLLKEVLQNKKTRPWNEDMIQSLDHASSIVVSHLAPPKSQSQKIARGLVLGYVQSGKTANFSAVISKAVDSGYKLVVVLAGMHNILRLQTQTRLHEEIVLPKERACTTLTKVDEQGDFQKKQFVTANRALGSGDGFTLVVLKKNSSVLRNFNAWLAEASEETLKQCPALVIDDESDQASINTSRPEDDPTAINDHIRRLLKRFFVCSYVGYTATPFANVLIDSSVDDDLYPRDFLITLDNPLGYVGAEELFGRDAIEPHGASEGLPVIRTIPPAEGAALSSTKSREDDIPPSLSEALDSFLVGASARLARDQWKQHMTMLIHTSHLVDRHRGLKAKLDEHVLSLKLDRKEASESLRTRLEKLWEKDFLSVSRGFKAADIPTFEKVWKNSERVIEKLEVIMENSASEERLTYNRPDPFWGIVVGGNTLSRGLTLEGLTTSYFVRGSKGYDTLLQMGRWFGYRPGYVDLTRIYVTEDLQSKFYHLATVEQEIRDEIRTMASNQERPIDVGLKIRTHPSMTVTSNLKMRTAQPGSLTYSGSKIQALYMNLKSPDVISSNTRATISFLNSIEKYHGKPQPPTLEDLSACLLYRDVSTELVLRFLETYKFSRANIRFTSEMVSNYISDLNQLGELRNWSVAVMSSKSGDRFNLGEGRIAYKVRRSIVKRAHSELDRDAQHIKVLTAPGDEMIDLTDRLGEGRFKNTEEIFASEEAFKEIHYRQNVRPKDRGLILLYPIEGNSTMSEEEAQRHLSSPAQTMPVRSVQDVIGVAFVFPRTNNSKSTYNYVVNGTV